MNPEPRPANDPDLKGAPPPLIRRARPDELAALLELYTHLKADEPPPPAAMAAEAWRAILADGNIHVLIAEVDGTPAASVTLHIAPNLTAGARPWAIIENVVTHRDLRGRGLATALLHHARQLAWDRGCYKVMIQTGAKDAATLRFYEKAGFKAGVKTALHAGRPA